MGHLAAAEGHLDMLIYLAQSTNFNFNLKDRWGNTIITEIKDRAIKEEVDEALKRRQQKHRRTSVFLPES